MNDAFSRRSFLGAALSVSVLAIPNRYESRADESPRVMTVRGWIPVETLGVTLPHEHVLVDFIGADRIGPDRYDPDEVFEVALPYLLQVKELGCEALVECTPAFIGRDAALLKRLSEASEMHLLTNTGYYAAAGERFVPAYAYEESADRLAERWIREWREGIEGSDVRPGFIKIGVDGAPISDVGRKIVTAAARAHLETGLTIAAHTGDGAAAMEELEILEAEGVHPSAFIWVHAQNEIDENLHLRAAEMGAWVSFDGLAPANEERYLAFASFMKENDALEHCMLSHDAGWYSVGEERGGTFRPFDTLFRRLLPALRERGFSDDDIQTILARNPAEAFTVRVREI